MFSWIKDTVGSIVGWLGDGVGAFFEWLLGGLATIVTALVDGVAAFGEVIDSLWEFAVGFKDTIFSLLALFFPFVPAPVLSVISLGMLAILIAGIVKKVRKE